MKTTDTQTAEQLREKDTEIAELRARLEEAEETLRAIREGEVDAVIVSGSKGDRVFALSESDNLHRLMVETMNEAGLAATPDGLLVFCNDRAAALFGRTKEQLLGHDLAEFAAPSDTERVRDLLRTAAIVPADARIEFRAAAGMQVPMHVWANFLDRPDSPLICLVATDLSRVEADRELIDELQRQRKQLRESEERLRLVLQASAMGTFEVDLVTGEGQWNEVEFELLGLKPGSVSPCPESFFRFVHPEDLATVLEKWEAALKGGVLDAEFRIVRADGELRWLAVKGQFMYDDRTEDGAPSARKRAVRFMGMNFDITARQQAEEALRDSERRERERAAELQTILDTAPIGLAIADDALGHHIRGNRANEQMFGLPPGAELSKAGPQPARFRIFQGGRELGAAELPMQRAGRGETVTAQVMDVLLEDGQTLTVYAKAAPVLDEAGRPRGAVGAFVDITALKQAEEQASRSQKMLSDLIERSPFGTYVVDSQFRVAMMNTTSQEVAFRNVRPIIGRPFEEAMRILWPEPVAAEIIGHFRHTLTTGESYYSPPFMNPRHDAEIDESYEWELHRMALPDGQFGVICYYYDSTKLRQAEAALRESEERLRLAQGYGGVGVWDWNVQNEQLAFEPELEQLYGLVPGSIRTYQDWASHVHPADLARIEAERATALDGRQPFQVEFRIRHATGTERWIMAKGRGEYDDAGRLLYVRGVNIDFTERKQAEEQACRLHESIAQEKDRLSALVNSIADEIWFADSVGQFTLVNPVASSEFALRTSGGADVRELAVNLEVLRPDGSPRPVEEAPPLRALCGEIVRNQEEQVRTPATGELRWRQVSAAPVRDSAGQVIGSVSVVRDITERKRDEESIRRFNVELERRVEARTAELTATNRELEAFCYSVSHDLRTPLRGMDGFSQALLEDCSSQLDATGRDHLQRVRSNCQRMGRLIDDLLNLSRLTRAHMRHTTVDLTAVAEKAVAELRESAPSRTVEVRIAPGLAAKGDPTLLGTALSNLLDNAWKFTSQRPDAVIEFGVERLPVPAASDVAQPPLPNDQTVFFVRDNGVGFEMRYADKLFSPFQRLHAITEFPGSGIGLATVQRVIQRHGGRVWFESAPGEGATFYFTLELEPAKPPQ